MEYSLKTLESYNRYAQEYDDKFSNHSPYYRQIKKFIRLFKDRSDILDAGCGTGLNARCFTKAGHNVTGFDFSQSMVRLARENCPEGKFTVSTVQDFKYDRKFHGICLSFIIVHLVDKDVKQLIKKTSNSLESGGYLYISFMTGRQPGYETTSFSGSEIYFNYFDKKEIIELVKKNGLVLVYSDSEPYEETDGSITEDIFLVFRK